MNAKPKRTSPVGRGPRNKTKLLERADPIQWRSGCAACKVRRCTSICACVMGCGTVNATRCGMDQLGRLAQNHHSSRRHSEGPAFVATSGGKLNACNRPANKMTSTSRLSEHRAICMRGPVEKPMKADGVPDRCTQPEMQKPPDTLVRHLLLISWTVSSKPLGGP